MLKEIQAAGPASGSVAAVRRPVLRLEKLSKTFGGTRALRDVALEIAAGEIHALVGQNGSGKSTLIKMLAGYHHADPGAQAWLDGEPFDLAAVTDARHDRLRFVHQDLGLVLELSAHGQPRAQPRLRPHAARVESIGSEQERDRRALIGRSASTSTSTVPLLYATPVERTIVAIAAALQGWEGGRGVLVLDEPTAVLPPSEVEQAVRDRARGPAQRRQRPLRLAPARRDLRARRSRHRAARRPAHRHARRRRAHAADASRPMMVGEDVDISAPRPRRRDRRAGARSRSATARPGSCAASSFDAARGRGARHRRPARLRPRRRCPTRSPARRRAP